MSEPEREPLPVQVARDIAAQHELFALVLDAIEERCSSFALDDAGDREACALAIVSALMSRGVKL